jgi:hypothetical protein
MNDPANKFPLEGEKGDPKVNATEQDVITNKDDTEKVVNQDGPVADTEGIEETLSESEPSLDLNVDKEITTDHGVTNSETDQDKIF